MKTNLQKEAIEAFKAKKGELPADAGYPVIRERGGDVYFTRSVDDWNQFEQGQKLYGNLFKVVLFCIAIALVAVVVGILFHADIWLILAICVASQVIPIIYMALVLQATKKHLNDLYVYVGERKKIYGIV